MSTERTDYIIYGFKISNADLTEGLENKLENQNKLTFLVDGMNGKYNLLGIKIQKSLEYEGIPLTSIRINENGNYRDLERELENVLDELDERWIYGSMCPKLHIVTHWH